MYKGAHQPTMRFQRPRAPMRTAMKILTPPELHAWSSRLSIMETMITPQTISRSVKILRKLVTLSKTFSSFHGYGWIGLLLRQLFHLEQVFTEVDDKTKFGTTLRLSQSTAKKAYSVVEKVSVAIVKRHDNPVMLIIPLRNGVPKFYPRVDSFVEPQSNAGRSTVG